jgi:hypothetical protein
MFEEVRRSPDLASYFYSCAYGRRQEDLAKLMQQALDQGWRHLRSLLLRWLS